MHAPQLWYVVDGAVGVTINDTQWILAKDSVFMVPPGKPAQRRGRLRPGAGT